MLFALITLGVAEYGKSIRLCVFIVETSMMMYVYVQG
jgi:hypothetical protein